MARSRPDYVAEAWLALGALGLIAGIVGLLVSGLLWTVPDPRLVAVALLLVAALPTLVYAWRRRGREWLVPVVAAVVAIVAGIVVVDRYEPTGPAVREVYAATPVATWPGVSTPTTFDDCRYWCIPGGLPGTSVAVEVTVADVQGECRRMVDELVGAGWVRAPFEAYTDWCVAELTRPAPISRTYVLNLSISPDDVSPVVDVAHGPAQPGRVFVSLRVT